MEQAKFLLINIEIEKYQKTDTNQVIHHQMHMNGGLLSDPPLLIVASDIKMTFS